MAFRIARGYVVAFKEASKREILGGADISKQLCQLQEQSQSTFKQLDVAVTKFI